MKQTRLWVSFPLIILWPFLRVFNAKILPACFPALILDLVPLSFVPCQAEAGPSIPTRTEHMKVSLSSKKMLVVELSVDGLGCRYKSRKRWSLQTLIQTQNPLKGAACSWSKSVSAVSASSAAAFQRQENVCSLWTASIAANRANPACQGLTPGLALHTPWPHWTQSRQTSQPKVWDTRRNRLKIYFKSNSNSSSCIKKTKLLKVCQAKMPSSVTGFTSIPCWLISAILKLSYNNPHFLPLKVILSGSFT